MGKSVKPWADVEQTEEFKSLPLAEKQQAQQDYFNQVVAPKLQTPEDRMDARKDFFSQYTYSAEALMGATEAENIANMLGVKPDKIDTMKGGKFLDRMDYSASDTDAEVVNKFADKYPEGAMFRVEIPREGMGKLVLPSSRLVFKYNISDDGEKWKTVEDIGQSYKDVADLAAPAAKAGVTIAGGLMTGGQSIIGQMLAYGGWAAGSHAIKETLEQARGTQLQPLSEVATQAGLEGATTSVLTGVTGAAVKGLNVLAGRGALKQHPEIALMIKNINKARQGGLKVESLMAHQQSPENMILSRFGAQAESTSKGAQHKLMTQKASAFDALKMDEGTGYKAGKVVLKEAKKAYNKQIETLKNKIGRITPRQADRSLSDAVDDFVTTSRNNVSLKYNLVDEAAATENPRFDLTGIKSKGKQISSLVMGDAKTTVIPDEPMATQINVAPTPEGRLIGIINDINRLDPVQTDYQVLKSLRTRTGDLIETWPWDATINKGQAKALYNTLTQAMNNPTNSAPNFVRLHSQASAAAKARYDFLDSLSVQNLIRFEPTGSLIKQLSKPNALTDVHLSLFKDKSFPQKRLMDIKKGIKNEILLDENGAINAIQRFRKDDPEVWRFLVKKTEERNIYKLANDIDKLNSSNIAQVVKGNTEATQVVNDLLMRKGTSRADILEATEMLGNRGIQKLRTAIYEDIINKSKTTIKGIDTIDKKALGKVIDEYKSQGIWDSPILTKNDRLKIQGLKSYLDLIFWRGADPGVSLEAAQAITDLKHPITFINGVHKLTVNSLLAKFLSSKAGNKLLIGNGKEAFKSSGLIATTIMIDGLMEGTEPGDQSLETSYER